MTDMEQIEQWAAHKSFDLLAPDEQTQVLAFISKAAYENLHLLLSSAQRLDEDVSPPPSLRSTVLQQFDARNQPRPAMRGALPWLGMAASFLLGIGLTYLFFGQGRTQQPGMVQTPVILHDTIIARDTIWKTNTLVRYAIRYKTINYDPVDTVDTSIPVAYHIPRDTSVTGQAYRYNLPQTTVGMPISDNPELWQFFTAGK